MANTFIITALRDQEARLAEVEAERDWLRKELSKAAYRLDLAKDWMADSFGISGTLRAERTIKLQHCADEARQALGAKP